MAAQGESGGGREGQWDMQGNLLKFPMKKIQNVSIDAFKDDLRDV